MVRRLFAVIALAMAALLAVAGPAAADPGYAPTSASGTVSDGTIAPGGSTVFCGEGFAPGTDLVIAANGQTITTIQAEDDGSFCIELEAKAADVGTYTLTATGEAADGGTLTVSATVTVVAAGGAGSGSGSDAGSGTGGGGLSAGGALPRTGSEIGTQLWIAGGLLALGAGLVSLTVVRRRDAGLSAA